MSAAESCVSWLFGAAHQARGVIAMDGTRAELNASAALLPLYQAVVDLRQQTMQVNTSLQPTGVEKWFPSIEI